MAKNTKLTEAELINVLRLVETHPTQAEAARTLGITPSAFRSRVEQARALGLTANSKTKQNLRDQVTALKRQVKMLEKGQNDEVEIRSTIYGLAKREPQPPRWLSAKPEAFDSYLPGTPITMWSDWHSGETVDREQVGGQNEFNKEIFERRVEVLVEKIVKLCAIQCRDDFSKYEGIVVCLGGDMISGDIHEELRDSNWGTAEQQTNHLTDVLIAALKQVADVFGRVHVVCVVGNHGRSNMKVRFKGRVFMSYEWLCYQSIERYFKDDKRLTFQIPNETDARFAVNGHKYLLTHGDALGVRGGDGIIGSIGPIMRGTLKVARAESVVGKDFDTIIMGHWHQYMPLPGCIVNGALKGYCEFARLALRAPYSPPIQALWFTHPQHGITMHLPVVLEDLAETSAHESWVMVPEVSV